MGSTTLALAKLLSDDDPDTIRLVKEQLTAIGEENPSALQELANADDARVSFHARDVLTHIDGCRAENDFNLLCLLSGEIFDIEEAAWALAKVIDPSASLFDFRDQINDWGSEFLERVACVSDNAERVQLLSEFLGEELEIRGNSVQYYCEENSHLPYIIETRMGIPITLTLLYQMVAARAGMKIEGINLPGHFIARHGDVFFDPFHGGRILSRADIEQILIRQGMELRDFHLLPANSRQFLLRILANLLYVYDLAGDKEKRARIKSWMEVLAGATINK
jgi:regulator of sirC expression with transglutaminase-like and TPR domain